MLVEPFGPSFSAILEKLVQDPTVQAVECISAMDTLSVVRQMNCCVILAHAANANDVNQHLTILKTLAPQIQTRKSVRMLVTAASSLTAELVEKLTIYGCAEIIPDSTPGPRPLLFKQLDRHLKALPRGGEQSLPRRTSLGFRAIRPALRSPVRRRSPLPSLRRECGSRRSRICPRTSGACRAEARGAAGDSWRIKIRGPAPDHGRWMTTDKKNVWHWRLSEERDGARNMDPQVGWFFGGELRPEYQRGFWTFVGASPWLG